VVHGNAGRSAGGEETGRSHALYPGKDAECHCGTRFCKVEEPHSGQEGKGSDDEEDSELMAEPQPCDGGSYVERGVRTLCSNSDKTAPLCSSHCPPRCRRCYHYVERGGARAEKTQKSAEEIRGKVAK